MRQVLPLLLAVLVAPSCTGESEENALPLVEDRVFQNAPLGFVEMEDLSPKSPESWEAKEDELERPYHLLLRIVRWPDLELVDVPPAQLDVIGASGSRRIRPGEYLFSPMANGLTRAQILAPQDPNEPRIPGRKPILTERNPIPLARHAITIADLLLVPDEEKQKTCDFRGLVVDRTDGRPIPGAIVTVLGGPETSTDEQGRFDFPEPITVEQIFKIQILAGGFHPQFISYRNIGTRWVREFQKTGVAKVRLLRMATADTSRPVNPAFVLPR